MIQYLQEVLVHQENLSMHQITDSVNLTVLILITLLSSLTSFLQVSHQLGCHQYWRFRCAVKLEYTNQISRWGLESSTVHTAADLQMWEGTAYPVQFGNMKCRQCSRCKSQWKVEIDFFGYRCQPWRQMQVLSTWLYPLKGLNGQLTIN